ncbi:S8 family peptidase [Terrisporobacter hibernicus]|uniref:S8 family peptidase n=1 Tax=Terrisporobacter hibernicus TaxID=2813371 RepID=A0AAX2ZI34_9FIRM|nr:S8 family peptidase [Terrisporobacter hibernicus]UEL48460.1 S8 family peptidase [Terrisporobacter hibernicus]
MKNQNDDYKVKLIPFIMNRGVKNTGKTPYGVTMIQAKNMWSESSRGEGINIAVIDSGCDIDHESLKENFAFVRNFTDEDKKNPNIVIDRVGHGTHVAGIIAANGNNNTVVGVAPWANLYILKAIDKTGSGKVSWVINAINYAVEKKVDIISMSLGMPNNDPKLEKSIKHAVNNNILVVCAAGNEGDGNSGDFEYSYPASYVDVISVGAVDKKGVPASFSNANLVVDLVAPGVDVVSTYPNNQFASLSGTSMAAPHVSGSLALLKNWSHEEFQRDLTQEEIYAQLIKYTKNLGYPRTVQGNGLIYLKDKK